MPPSTKNQIRVMRPEINTVNWRWLLWYIENASDLHSGYEGQEAVDKTLDGLILDPNLRIQNPKKTDECLVIQECHLRKKGYWHDNKFSLALFDNVAEVIGGPQPLYQAGIFCGYQIIDEKSLTNLLRLFDYHILHSLIGLINRRFNKTKKPKQIEYKRGRSLAKMNYLETFRDEIREHGKRHVCDWNRGIYTGMGKYTGAKDIKVTEIECVVEGDPDCIFEATWTHLNPWTRFLITAHGAADHSWLRDVDLDNIRLTDEIMRRDQVIQFQTEEVQRFADAVGKRLNPNLTYKLEHGRENELTQNSKDISIIVADIEGSTKKSGELGVKDYEELIGSYRKEMTRIMGGHGFYVEKFEGDGFLAYIGSFRNPKETKLQEDAIKCVDMALEMQKWIGKNMPTKVRMGIASGEVTVGEKQDENIIKYTAIGKYVNFAAKLEPELKKYPKRDSDILIAPETRDLVSKHFLTRQINIDIGKEFPNQSYLVMGKTK